MEDTIGLLEALPPEIKNKILEELPDIRSVLNLSLTGPAFYNHIFYDDGGFYERKIASTMVVAQVGITLLPMAIARYEASLTSWKRVCSLGTEAPIPVTSSWLCDQIVEFVDEHFTHLTGRHITRLPVAFASLSIADNIISCHKAIQHFTGYLSAKAAENTSGHRCSSSVATGEAIIPNDRENTRLSKALYIFELASELFVINKGNSVVWDVHWETTLAVEAFWRKFAPWENQQVRYVQTLLMEYAIHEFPDVILVVPRYSWNKFWGLVVLSQGVTGLQNVYRRGHHLIPPGINFAHLYRSRYRILTLLQAPEINAAWYNSDILWLKRTDQLGQSLYSCDIADLLRAFPEEDSGPADAWYHMLFEFIQLQLPNQALASQERGSFTRCALCFTYWGFQFWDRERLDHYSQGRFPTMEAMDRKMREYSGDHLSVSEWVLDRAPNYEVPSQSCQCSHP
ncbi:hypothetical protein F4776DRAFT_665407 [Hypoxylon sp. NC0597]|nr:hypothetical protein F4776DRAFT_665407 [Hypoxylon sp. NC0597]